MHNPNQSRWLELWKKLGTHSEMRPVYVELEQHYTEPKRAYTISTISTIAFVNLIP